MHTLLRLQLNTGCMAAAHLAWHDLICSASCSAASDKQVLLHAALTQLALCEKNMQHRHAKQSWTRNACQGNNSHESSLKVKMHAQVSKQYSCVTSMHRVRHTQASAAPFLSQSDILPLCLVCNESLSCSCFGCLTSVLPFLQS